LQVRWNEQRARLEQAERDYEDRRRAETAAVGPRPEHHEVRRPNLPGEIAALEPLVNDIMHPLDPHPRSRSWTFASRRPIKGDPSVAKPGRGRRRRHHSYPMTSFLTQANASVVRIFSCARLGIRGPGASVCVARDRSSVDDVNVLGFATARLSVANGNWGSRRTKTVRRSP